MVMTTGWIRNERNPLCVEWRKLNSEEQRMFRHGTFEADVLALTGNFEAIISQKDAGVGDADAPFMRKIFKIRKEK